MTKMQKVIITLLFGIVYNCHGSPLYLAVGYYPLTSSTAANDSSLSKNPPGQLANAQISTGVYGENGGSYSFSGTRSPPSYIRLPSSDALDTRYSITLLAWVYPEGTGGEIISYWQDSDYGVSISIENSRPVFHLYTRDQSNKFSLPSTMKLQSRKWNHIAGSFDNMTGNAILYVNGIQVGNKTGLGILELQTEYDLWLGYLFKGKLSQIWIFNVSLDKQNIKQVMDFMKSTPSPTSTSSPAYATFASSFAYITSEIAMKSLFTHSAQLASQKYVFVSPTVSHTETIRITSTTPLSKPVTVMTQNVSTPVVTTQNVSLTPVLTNQNVSTTVVTNSQNINSSRVLNSQQATTSSVTPVSVVDNFGIVEPYPENIYALEFTSAQVTCIAFDSTGLKTPERIQFIRRDSLARRTNITTNNHTYFTSEVIEVEQGGKKLKKLFVTLHLRNITQEDDSAHGKLGRYECHAFAAGEPNAWPQLHGFSVNVIANSSKQTYQLNLDGRGNCLPKRSQIIFEGWWHNSTCLPGNEIPIVTVSKTRALQHGDNFTIVCGVTNLHLSTLLRTLSWYKDGVLKRHVYVKNPNPGNASDAFGPLVVENAVVKDGGNYTCVLHLLLRGVAEHNVSNTSVVQIVPWLDKPKQDLEFERFKGDNVSFECGAKGFPLQPVEWKFQKIGDETTLSFIANKVGKYLIERSGIYDPYVLTVFDTQYADCGNYYCCLRSNKSDNVSSISSNDCQRFVLWVREACRKKPELVAIIEGGAEVIRGLHENITMNASLSYDPDIGTRNNSGMNFTWHFGQIKGNSSFPFPGLSNIAVQYFAEKGFGSVVTFAKKPLLLNQTYIMKLVVTKDYRTSSVFQVIRLQKGEPPRILLSCLLNCGVQTIPSVRLSIKSQCQGSQCSKIFSYEWTLYEQNKSASNTNPIWRRANILQSITTTPLNSSNIAIKENSLDGRKDYRLVLFVRTKDGTEGLSAYDIVTATPPSGGRCAIIPSSGISLKTDFNLSCSDWVSDATPLTYQFQYRLDNGLYSMVYYGVNNTVISWLPPGNRSHNYKVEFLATVTNSYGASAPTVNLSVRVKPSQHLSPANFTSVLTSNDSFFYQVIEDGDLNKAAQIANTILEAISQDSSLSTEGNTKIQELIVEKIAALQVKSLPDLLQSSSVIGSAIKDTDTTSVKSLEFAIPAIDSMASLLWNAAQQKHIDDIPLITLSAENLGSCLNNVLKSASIIASGKFGSSPQEQGKALVKESFRIINIIADAVLAMKVADEKVTRIKTTELSMTLGRHTPTKLVGLSIEGGDGRFVLPDEKGTLDSRIGNTAFVDSQMLSIPFNPYTWDITRERVDSDILALDLKDDERKLIKVSGLPNDVLIVTPLKPQQLSLQIPQYFAQNDNLGFHLIDVKYENTLIMVEITPTDESVTLFVYMRHSQRPTTQVYDFNATISKQETCIWWNAQEKSFGRVKCSSNRFTVVPIETVARQPGRYFLGIQSYNTSVTSLKRQKRSCFGNKRQKRSCVQVKDPPPTPPQSKNVSVVPVYDPTISRNYTMRVALGSCVFWSEKLQMWTTEGCQVLSATLNGFLNCSCNHLTSFGGSFFVKPNPIDFDQVLVEFKRLADTGNVPVIVTVAVAFLCYVFVIVFVRKADQQDTRNNGSPVELPTGSNSLHEYEIKIITGVWRNSGTTAKVAIEIYGSEESTGKVLLNNMEDSPTGTLFSRGNTDVFVLKVEKPLGSIQGVRFGHDNSGNSPSWFLEEIIVLDKQTLCSWTFTNTQWLALERGDGRIERILETEQNKIDFNSEVLKRWWKGLTEKHIWVSVIAKPRRNRFTRVQRASCCLSLLLTAMLANAMFYELDGKSENVIQIGPLKFTWRQVVIGIESALIVAPINIFIAFLFQKGTENTDSQIRVCCKAKCLIYFAWFIFVCSCSVSATFTIFYSLVWGKEISEQWLSSMFISFTQDMAITEPVKVFFTAIVLSAMIIRKKRKKDGSEYVKEAKTRSSTKGHLWKMKLKEVEEMRRRQAKKQNLSRFFVELFIYLIFVFLLMVVCYGTRNEHRYMMTKSITEGLPKFEAVFNKKQYWSWVRNVFLPGVFAGRWYNGRPENQTVYIGNKRSVLVGMARGRQLRVQPETCDVLDYMKHMFPVCYGGYSRLIEDKTSFNEPGWKPVDNSTNKDELFRLCPKPWRYQGAEDTDTVPKWGQFSFYPGGGFVADLGYENSTGFTVIETLQNNDWLDRRTRAIILEFSSFNPSVNLLCIATYFFEIEASGYSVPSTRTEVISLDSTGAGSQQFYLICILFFIIFVAFYLGRECYRLYKQRSRYFKSLWGWVEIFQVLFSLLAVVMYIVRSKKATSTIQELQKNIYANLSFQEVIIWLEIENAALGILTFIVTAKLLRLIRFNQHVVVFSKTLKTSARLLSSFTVVMLICFTAFLHFGVLIFGTGSRHYSSILRATYFQLELTLGRVKARPINELADANDTFGRIFAILLLFTLTILAMNFFIAIMNDALMNAKACASENELYDLLDENWSQKEGENKRIFDAISESLKVTKGNEEIVKMTKTEIRNCGENPNKKRVVNFEAISKAITVSREESVENSTEKKLNVNTRRKSLFDKISDYILKKFTSSQEHIIKKELRSSHSQQHRKVRFSEDVIKCQFQKLQKQKKFLFQRLDNIIQGYSDEEDKLQLLCYEVGYSSKDATTVADQGATNDSFA